MRGFDNIIGHHAYEPAVKLAQLIQMCTGEAKDAIKHLVIVDSPSEGYQAARDNLLYRFGNRTLVIDAHIRQLTEGPRIRTSDTKALCRLASQMRNCFIILTQWKAEQMLDAQAYLKDIFRRLPPTLQADYVHDTSWKNHPIPSFTHLLEFVELRAHLSNNLYGRLMAENDNKPRANDHPLYRCATFKQYDLQHRRDFIRENNLCFNCMRSGHIVKECPSQKRCQADGCTRKHHTLLQQNEMPTRPRSPVTGNIPTDTNSKVNSTNVSSCFANVVNFCDIDCFVRLMVVPVEVKVCDSNHRSLTYAFLDYGATRSLCSTKLARDLALNGEPERCTIRTATGPKLHDGMKASFTIRGVHEPQTVDVHHALTFDSIPDVRDSIPNTEATHRYPHLRDLNFPLLDKPIDLLIGADVLGRYPITETRVGAAGFPTALHTILGWALTGPDVSIAETNAEVNYLNTIQPIDCYFTDFSSFNEPICHMCAHDFADVNANPCITQPSQDDRRALDFKNQTVTKVDGRFQIGLPWKSDTVSLPYNRNIAEKRLMYLKRKFIGDPELFQNY
ncbi:uncharacterized protein LOC144427227 [Styela clava]